MKQIKITINKGQEVMETLSKEFSKQKIREGAIISIVGAVDECCISNMPKDDASKDLKTEYHEPFELSGVGEVKEGKPHIHCTLSREGDSVIAGHLHSAKVKTWHVNIYLLIDN